jgi:hypothetical protein
MRDGDARFVYYKESTSSVKFKTEGGSKKVIAVDALSSYTEIDVGTFENGWHTWSAPKQSDWALAADNAVAVSGAQRNTGMAGTANAIARLSVRDRTLTFSSPQIGAASLLTVSGKTLRSQQVSASQLCTWNLAALPRGAYLLRIVGSQATTSQIIGVSP